MKRLLKKTRLWNISSNDAGLTILTFVQVTTTFVIVPFLGMHLTGRWLLDACRLVSAVICAIAFTDRRSIQAALLATLIVIVVAPATWIRMTTGLAVDQTFTHESIACGAFAFNGLITILVARYIFGDGRVTGARVLGAVLIYLNVAVLFSIAYDMLNTFAPGAIQASAAQVPSVAAAGAQTVLPSRIAEFSYFSLSTITTVGYGDFIPVHPLARSLANLEAVFGGLFPAIFVSRLVALHLAHTEKK